MIFITPPHQPPKVGSDGMKARYDSLANCAGFQEGDKARLYRPTQSRGKSPKLQPSWKGPYKAITQINDMVCRIQRHPTVKMVVVNLHRLAPCLGATWDEQPNGGSSVADLLTNIACSAAPTPAVTPVCYVRRLLEANQLDCKQ
jgi:hypothetical protein